MCRALVYLGQPVLLDNLLYQPDSSLVKQAFMPRKLRMLNNAATVEDLRVPPANRLEALKGVRKGQHGIRINDQWRVCFRWKEGDAFDVTIVDYH